MAVVRRETASHRRPFSKAMKKPQPKKQPIKIIVAFEPVTVERFDALSEAAKDAVATLVEDFLRQVAREEAERRAAIGMAA